MGQQGGRGWDDRRRSGRLARLQHRDRFGTAACIGAGIRLGQRYRGDLMQSWLRQAALEIAKQPSCRGMGRPAALMGGKDRHKGRRHGGVVSA